ncbi:MAG TPA: hypothetical protein VKT53_14250 [Candidatus Acidoferrum sp.]|nr:hypothetical protein [Candidatus Acidoferrum sp.]
MKRPLGVLVIAFTGWVLSAFLLLAMVAINRSPEAKGVSASLCLLMAVLIAAVCVGLFRLNYWARVTLLLMTSVTLAISVLFILDYVTTPLSDREIHFSTVLFWIMAVGVIWYMRRPSIKKAFGIGPE